MTHDKQAERACAVPLVDRLRNVPEKARYSLDVGKYETRYWPVGALCHEAADALSHLSGAQKKEGEASEEIHLAWRGALKACGVSDGDRESICEVVLGMLGDERVAWQSNVVTTPPAAAEVPAVPSFAAAWAKKGYLYSDSNIEKVRMGWDMAMTALEFQPAYAPAIAYLRATKPKADSTEAPEVSEREAFEAWANNEKLALNRHRDSYASTSTAWCWDAWQARAILALRPKAQLTYEGFEALWRSMYPISGAGEERTTKALARVFWEAGVEVKAQPLTERQLVACLVESGCLGTVKMSYDSGPYEITRTSINADRFARAIERAHGIASSTKEGNGNA